jgi:hypothetical protein
VACKSEHEPWERAGWCVGVCGEVGRHLALSLIEALFAVAITSILHVHQAWHALGYSACVHGWSSL